MKKHVENFIQERIEKTSKIKVGSMLHNIFIYFWIFWIGSFLGVIIETLWCIFKNGIIESRTALIYESLNPIYGLGALLLTLCLYKIKDKSAILIFLVGGVAGGLFEALCSLVQELCFGTISWHYSADSFGILWGRTSLIYCIYWGVLGIAWIKVIYPFAVEKISNVKVHILSHMTYLFVFIFVFDCVMSCMAVYRQDQRRNNIEPKTFIGEYFDDNYTDERLKEIYPNMWSVD